MSKVTETRRANIRALIEERGGLSKLSKAMGYRNPSFLSQMTGPEPTRDITEKTARKIEQVLGLQAGTLDQPGGAQRPEPTPASSTVQLVADVIRIVGSACEAEGVSPGPSKFAELVALAYSDSVERGAARPEHIKSVVRLLR